MDSNYTDMVFKMLKLGDEGHRTPIHKPSIDDEDLSKVPEPDFGYDNYETLSYRWDQGLVEMNDVMEHPYDFQRWLDNNEDMDLSSYVEEINYVQSILPRWALHEERDRIQIPKAMREYWNRKLKNLEIAEKRKSDAEHYALYVWEEAV